MRKGMKVKISWGHMPCWKEALGVNLTWSPQSWALAHWDPCGDSGGHVVGVTVYHFPHGPLQEALSRIVDLGDILSETVSVVETFRDDLTSWIWAREFRTLLARQPLSWSTVTNSHLSKPYRVNDIFSMSPIVQRLTAQENQPWRPAYVWRNYVSTWPRCQWTCFKGTPRVTENRTGLLKGGT
jgi:hypothetical protein